MLLMLDLFIHILHLPLFTIGTVSVLAICDGSPEEHDFTHVMEETYKLKPIRMVGLAYAFGGLKEVKTVGLW